MSGTRGDICIKTTCIAQHHQPGLSICLSVRVEKHGVIRRGLIDVVHTQYSLKKNNTGTGYHKVGATCIENFMVTILRYAMWGVMLANL